MKRNVRIASLFLAIWMIFSCNFSALAQSDALPMVTEVEQPAAPMADATGDEIADEQAAEPEQPKADEADDETADEQAAAPDGDEPGDALPADPEDEETTISLTAPLTATLADATVTNGTVTFEVAVAAGAYDALTYRWQSLNTSDLPADADGDALHAAREAAWADIAGEATATLTLEGLTDENQAAYELMRYRCVVTLGDESVTTNEACVLFGDLELAEVTPLATKEEVSLSGTYMTLNKEPLFAYSQQYSDVVWKKVNFDAQLRNDEVEDFEPKLTAASIEWISGNASFKDAFSIDYSNFANNYAEINCNCTLLTQPGTAVFRVRLEAENYYAQSDITVNVIEYDSSYVIQNKPYLYIEQTGVRVDMFSMLEDLFTYSQEISYHMSPYFGGRDALDNIESLDELYQVDNENVTYYYGQFTAKKPGIYPFSVSFTTYSNASEWFDFDVVVAMPYRLSAPKTKIEPGETLQITAEAIGQNSLTGATWTVQGSDYATITQNGVLTLDAECKEAGDLTVTLTPAGGGQAATLTIGIDVYTGNKQVTTFSSYTQEVFEAISTKGFYALPAGYEYTEDSPYSSYWNGIISLNDLQGDEERAQTITLERIGGDSALDDLFYVDYLERGADINVGFVTSDMVGTAAFRIVAETDTLHAEDTFSVTVRPFPTTPWPTQLKDAIVVDTLDETIDLSAQGFFTKASGFEEMYMLYCPYDDMGSSEHSNDGSWHPTLKDPKEQYDLTDGRYFTPQAEATFECVCFVECGLNLSTYHELNITVSIMELAEDYELQLSTKNDQTDLYPGNKLTVLATFAVPSRVKDKTISWSLTDKDGNPLSADIATISQKGVVTVSKNVTDPLEIYVHAKTARFDKSAELKLFIHIIPSELEIEGYQGNENPTTTLVITEEEPNPTFDFGSLVYAMPEGVPVACTYKSSNAKVASVDANGIITAQKPGTAVITVTSVANKKATNKMTITVEAPITGVRIAPKKGETLRIGQNVQFVAEIIPAVATDKRITWSVSPQDGHVTITQKGMLKCDKTTPPNQIYTVTATALGATQGDCVGSYQISVKPTVKSVSIALKSYEMNVGERLLESNMGIVVSPADANRDLEWTFNKPGIARVELDGEQMAVVGQMPGVVTLTLTARDGSGKKASIKITVTQPVTSIYVLGNTTLTAGKSTILTALVRPSDATSKKLTWSSSDTSIATVNASGKVTAKKGVSGEVTITATATDKSGVSGSKTITVTRQVPTGLTVSAPITKLNLAEQDSVTLTATCTPSDADPSVTWKTSNNRVATVSDTGKVQFMDAGSVTITAVSTVNKKAMGSVTLMGRIEDELSIISVQSSVQMVEPGESIPWDVRTNGGEQPLTYEYEVICSANGITSSVKKQTLKSKSYFTYTPKKAGEYGLRVTVTDAIGQRVTMDTFQDGPRITVRQANKANLSISGVAVNNITAILKSIGKKGRGVNIAYVGDIMSYTVKTEGGNAQEYRFTLTNQSGDSITSDWQTDEEWRTGKLQRSLCDSVSSYAFIDVKVEAKDQSGRIATWEAKGKNGLLLHKGRSELRSSYTLTIGEKGKFNLNLLDQIDYVFGYSVSDPSVVKLNNKTGEYTTIGTGICEVKAITSRGVTFNHRITVPELLCISRTTFEGSVVVGQKIQPSFTFTGGKSPYTAQLVLRNQKGKVVHKRNAPKQVGEWISIVERYSATFDWPNLAVAEPGLYTVECTIKDALGMKAFASVPLQVELAGSKTFSFSGVTNGGSYKIGSPLFITGRGSGYNSVHIVFTGPSGFVTEPYTFFMPFTKEFGPWVPGTYKLCAYDTSGNILQEVSFTFSR